MYTTPHPFPFRNAVRGKNHNPTEELRPEEWGTQLRKKPKKAHSLFTHRLTAPTFPEQVTHDRHNQTKKPRKKKEGTPWRTENGRQAHFLNMAS